MRRNFLVLAVVVMFGAAAGLAAQAKPDFTGKWVWDHTEGVYESPAEAAGAGAGDRGFTITQDAKTLTITQTQGDQTVTAVYNLDGSESKNTVQGRGGATERVSKAMWDGARLVITYTANFGGNAIDRKQTLSLEGGNLVVETTPPGRGGGPGTFIKIVYKKG